MPLGNLNENKHAFFGPHLAKQERALGFFFLIDTIIKPSPNFQTEDL